MSKKFKPKNEKDENVHFLDEQPARDNSAIILPLSLIKIEKNIRKKMEGIKELAESIKQNGLINPITVTQRDGEFILVAGERRFRALELLKETHAPARVNNSTSEQVEVLRLLENLDRQDLTGVEEIIAVAKLLPMFDNNQTALSKAISKSRTYVNQCCRAHTIIKKLGCSTSNSLTKSILFELANSKDPEKLWEEIQRGKAVTVKDARANSSSDGKDNPKQAGSPVSGGTIQFRDNPKKKSFSLKVVFNEESSSIEQRNELIKVLENLLKRLKGAR